MPSSSTALPRRRSRSPGAPTPWGMFVRGFLKHPLMVGSVIPSSKRLIATMLEPVDWSAAKVFVEYGPGVGTFSRPILDQLAPDAKLIAIDTNPDFVRYLRQTVADPRLAAVHGSATDVRAIVADHGFAEADYVLSGLPFSTLPPGVGDHIAGATRELIRPGGAFLVYQYSPKCRSFIAPHFARIDHRFLAWNLPPHQLYWAWKD